MKDCNVVENVSEQLLWVDQTTNSTFVKYFFKNPYGKEFAHFKPRFGIS